MEDDPNYFQFEDDLNIVVNGRKPHFLETDLLHLKVRINVDHLGGTVEFVVTIRRRS